MGGGVLRFRWCVFGERVFWCSLEGVWCEGMSLRKVPLRFVL